MISFYQSLSRIFFKICFSRSCSPSQATKQTYFGHFTLPQTHFGHSKLSSECYVTPQKYLNEFGSSYIAAVATTFFILFFSSGHSKSSNSLQGLLFGKIVCWIKTCLWYLEKNAISNYNKKWKLKSTQSHPEIYIYHLGLQRWSSAITALDLFNAEGKRTKLKK